MTSDLQAAAPDGFNEAVAAWQAHCECLSSDDHRKSPYWLPITECWSERRMQHAATLANRLLELTDPTPIDEAWLRSLGFLPGDEVPVELSLTIYGVGVYDDEEPHMHITWSSNDGCFWLEAYAANGDSLCVVELGRKTRGQLNLLLRAIKGE